VFVSRVCPRAIIRVGWCQTLKALRDRRQRACVRCVWTATSLQSCRPSIASHTPAPNTAVHPRTLRSRKRGTPRSGAGSHPHAKKPHAPPCFVRSSVLSGDDIILRRTLEGAEKCALRDLRRLLDTEVEYFILARRFSRLAGTERDGTRAERDGLVASAKRASSGTEKGYDRVRPTFASPSKMCLFVDSDC
jgi:hypothetical protein